MNDPKKNRRAHQGALSVAVRGRRTRLYRRGYPAARDSATAFARSPCRGTNLRTPGKNTTIFRCEGRVCGVHERGLVEAANKVHIDPSFQARRAGGGAVRTFWGIILLIFGAIVLTVALNVSLADVSSLGDLKLPFGAAIPMARTFAWALAPACALSALGLALLVSPISAAQIAFAGAVVVAVGLEFAAIRLGEPAFASGVLALIPAAFGLAALGRELQAHGAPSWSRAPLWV